MKYFLSFIGVFLLKILKALFIIFLLFWHLIAYPTCILLAFIWSFKFLKFGNYKVLYVDSDDWDEKQYIRGESISRFLYRLITLGPCEYPLLYNNYDYSYKGRLAWEYFKK